MQQGQVKEFISETPMEVHKTVKEQLTNFTMVRHSNKQKLQMQTTKGNEQTTTKFTHFQNKQQQQQNKKPEKGRSLRKTAMVRQACAFLHPPLIPKEEPFLYLIICQVSITILCHDIQLHTWGNDDVDIEHV